MQLIGHLNPGGMFPGFAIPVFGESGEVYEQIYNEHDQITGFQKINIDEHDFIEDRKQLELKANEIAVHSYIICEGSVVVGTRAQLRQVLSEEIYAPVLADFPFCRLELVRFMGSASRVIRSMNDVARGLATVGASYAEGWRSRESLRPLVGSFSVHDRPEYLEEQRRLEGAAKKVILMTESISNAIAPASYIRERSPADLEMKFADQIDKSVRSIWIAKVVDEMCNRSLQIQERLIDDPGFKVEVFYSKGLEVSGDLDRERLRYIQDLASQSEGLELRLASARNWPSCGLMVFEPGTPSVIAEAPQANASKPLHQSSGSVEINTESVQSALSDFSEIRKDALNPRDSLARLSDES